MQQVLDGKLSFHVFGKKTSMLLLGSRNNEQMPRSLNIVTVLEKCDKRYPGLMALYADLSESAHPSYEGMCMGYSKIDHDEYETHFSNRWMELYGDRHIGRWNYAWRRSITSTMTCGPLSWKSLKDGSRRTTPS